MSIKHLACRRTSHEKRGTARRRCGPEAARRAVAAPHRAAPARVSGVPPAPHPITLQDGAHGEIHLPDARRELRPQSQLLAVRRGAYAARRSISAPSTRRLRDGAAMPVPHHSIDGVIYEPAHPTVDLHAGGG